MKRGHPEDRTRLSWWFPRLPSDIPVPKTVIIPYTGDHLISLLCGDTPQGFYILCNRIIVASSKLGWPLFLRTDYFSGKHNWKNTCHVPGPECVAKRVAHLIEESAVTDILGLPTDCWITREFIPTNPVFYAFRGEMPIVKERRYFVQDAKVVCHHPYWPSEAFINQYVSIKHWRDSLSHMNVESDHEVDLLSTLSSSVGDKIGGAWSIDWLWSEDEGKWYLTDMAETSQSYHWPECHLIESE